MTDIEAIAHLRQHGFVVGRAPWSACRVLIAPDRWVEVVNGTYLPPWGDFRNQKMRVEIYGPVRRDQCHPEVMEWIKAKNKEAISHLPEPYCHPKSVADVLKHCS